MGRAGRPSGIQEENLQECISSATRDKKTDTLLWDKMSSLKTGIPGGAPPSGADLNNNGDTTKGRGGVQRDRAGRFYL